MGIVCCYSLKEKRNLKKSFLDLKQVPSPYLMTTISKYFHIYLWSCSLFENKSLTPKKGHIHLEILEAVEIADDETVEEFSIRTRDLLSKEKALLEKAGL